LHSYRHSRSDRPLSHHSDHMAERRNTGWSARRTSGRRGAQEAQESGSRHRRASTWSAHGPMIAAVIAAVAAVATAVISSQSNAADTQRRIQHETSEAHREAVGAARVLAKELSTVDVYLQGMLRVNQLIRWDEKYNVELSQEDQKLIASAPEIGVDRWQKVAAALTNLDSLEGYIRDKYRPGRHLDAGDVAVFSLDSKTIDRAWEALDPLSGTPRVLDDPLNGPVDGG
jgi:hypothetical protein